MNIFKWLRWLVDGDSEEENPPASQIEIPPGRRAEGFLVAVARAIEAEIQQERFTPPGGQAYLPRHYLVFLSPEEKRKWYGERREGMESWLTATLIERIERLSHGRISSVALEILTDGTLEGKQFRVQTLWGITRNNDREPQQVGNAEEAIARQTNLRSLTGR